VSNAHDTFHCPNCQSERYGTTSTRRQKCGAAVFVRRRRSCSTCGHRESTWEIPQELAKLAMLDELMAELEDGS